MNNRLVNIPIYKNILYESNVNNDIITDCRINIQYIIMISPIDSKYRTGCTLYLKDIGKTDTPLTYDQLITKLF